MKLKNPHQSVFLDPVVERLAVKPGDIVVDGTLGFAGHAYKLVDALQNTGRFIGIDQDAEALAYSQDKLKAFANVTLIQANYAQLPHLLADLNLTQIDKLLLDLGVSSWQLDQVSRGFSFQTEGPLDMRMNQSQSLTAHTILSTYSEDKLLQIFKAYGDLYHSHKLAKNIVQWRDSTPFLTTTDLTRVIKKSFFFNNQRSKMMKTFAQVFQAIRIEVNQELQVLDTILEALESLIAPQGRVAFITFHSLEDRRVKTFFKTHKEQFVPVGIKLKPSYIDAKDNPRSRSATLRVFQRTEK